MRHPVDGVLRRLIDEPAGVADADRRHVAECPTCLGALTAMREDADLVGAALTPAHGSVDVEAAWQRLSCATASPAPVKALRPRRTGGFLRRPAVAVAAVAVVVAGAGTAAANDWFQIFATEKVAPVSFSTADVMALPDLSAYGEVEMTSDGDVHSVPDAAVAAARTGLDVPEVADLPKGVSGAPEYQIAGKVTATFTFSLDKAAETAAGPLPTPPPGLDGTQVQLVAGPAVAATWGQGMPTLVVGRAVAPKAFSTGASFETVRDYLLSMPGLPADLATQLGTFTADGSTLPLPVPGDYVTTEQTEVNGVPATVLSTRDGAVAAVVWVADGQVSGVAGALDADEVLTIAEELR
jgi:hypothetical protein